MDVIIDGQRNFQWTGEPADVLAVVAAVSTFLREQGRDMVSVVCDGRPVSPERLIPELEGLPLASVARIEVGSEETLSMVDRCLRELEESIPELPAACRSLAAVFQGDSPEDGYDPFEKLADIWSHVKTRELLVASALSVDLAEHQIDGVAISELHEGLNSFLEEAALALQDGDCVLLGDLLEYELAPRAEQEAAIVALLREHAPAAA